MKIIILPYYKMGIIKMHAIIMYMMFSIMTMLSLLRASLSHPGRVPQYVGSMDQADWQYCDKCSHKRPPRSHHCSRCGHCVTMMDHHCPWINNCVGQDNRFAFLQLIFYTMGLSVSALAFCGSKSYKLPPCPEEYCPSDSWFVEHEHGLLVASYVMSTLMAVGITALSCGQHFSVALDVTTIESMIAKNPLDLYMSRPERPMKYRYDELCGTKNVLLWLWPCRSRLQNKQLLYDPHIV
ncbi:ZDHHC21 [Bugula neritina]|uniref:Palmitoyltransferase n=1 Tax=Bugula neritina TaxID=10212 RepID=A0A7J7J0C9_BUGNE|nr:ZDHHC21 [Bugula neritina]